jgi:hypothetical protein
MENFPEIQSATLRLTQYSPSGGCGCRIALRLLDEILTRHLHLAPDPRLRLAVRPEALEAFHPVTRRVGLDLRSIGTLGAPGDGPLIRVH